MTKADKLVEYHREEVVFLDFSPPPTSYTTKKERRML